MHHHTADRALAHGTLRPGLPSKLPPDRSKSLASAGEAQSLRARSCTTPAITNVPTAPAAALSTIIGHVAPGSSSRTIKTPAIAPGTAQTSRCDLSVTADLAFSALQLKLMGDGSQAHLSATLPRKACCGRTPLCEGQLVRAGLRWCVRRRGRLANHAVARGYWYRFRCRGRHCPLACLAQKRARLVVKNIQPSRCGTPAPRPDGSSSPYRADPKAISLAKRWAIVSTGTPTASCGRI